MHQTCNDTTSIIKVSMFDIPKRSQLDPNCHSIHTCTSNLQNRLKDRQIFFLFGKHAVIPIRYVSVPIWNLSSPDFSLCILGNMWFLCSALWYWGGSPDTHSFWIRYCWIEYSLTLCKCPTPAPIPCPVQNCISMPTLETGKSS